MNMPVAVVVKRAKRDHSKNDMARENGECMINMVPCNKDIECEHCEVLKELMDEVMK